MRRVWGHCRACEAKVERLVAEGPVGATFECRRCGTEVNGESTSPFVREDWVRATAPDLLLQFVEGRAGLQKFRLFGCACCRRAWRLFERDEARAVARFVEDTGEWGEADLARFSDLC